MKTIYKLLFFVEIVMLLSTGLTSCKDEQDNVNNAITIASLYPTIVMEGSTLWVTGSGLDKTLRVIFPGGVISDYVESKGDQMLLVKVPSNISSEEDVLILETTSGEVLSRQTIRKANPRLNYFIPAQEASTYNELSIIGFDFLLAEALFIDNGEDKLMINAIDFQRKSNTEIKVKLPANTPLGDVVFVSALFTNDIIVSLGSKIGRAHV